MRAPKVIKEGDESHLFLEFLYICNVFTKLDDLTRPKSITQAQKRIKKPQNPKTPKPHEICIE